MKKLIAYILPVILFVPMIISAHSIDGAVHPHLVLLGADIQCGGADCGFDNLVLFANGLITFLFQISIPFFVGFMVYAGFLSITSANNPGNISKAKGIFSTAIWGFVIMLSAWLIVYTLVNALVHPNYLDQNGVNFLRFLNK